MSCFFRDWGVGARGLCEVVEDAALGVIAHVPCGSTRTGLSLSPRPELVAGFMKMLKMVLIGCTSWLGYLECRPKTRGLLTFVGSK